CTLGHRVVAKLKDMQYGDVMPRNLSVHLRGGGPTRLWKVCTVQMGSCSAREATAKIALED
ncbi:MAG: hypothetical protein ACK5DM_00425, partial [Planctomyces sp.]